MASKDLYGIPFSCLKDRYEETGSGCDAWLRFGMFPDGTGYGAKKYPVPGDPWATGWEPVAVSPDGRIKRGAAVPGRARPEVVVRSPSGGALIWWAGGILAVTDRISFKEGWAWEVLNERIPGRPAVADAVLRADGLLYITLADGEKWACFPDAKALIRPAAGGWKIFDYPADLPGFTPDAEALKAAGVIITELSLAPGTFSIEALQFSGFEDLRQAELPAGLAEVGDLAFDGDEKLESIRIPASVTAVGYRAFGDCAALKELKIMGDPTRMKAWDEHAFDGCPCEGEYRRMRGG